MAAHIGDATRDFRVIGRRRNRWRIQRLDAHRNLEGSLVHDAVATLEIVPRGDLSGTRFQWQPVPRGGLVRTDDDLVIAFRIRLQRVVVERRRGACRRIAFTAPALDRERGEGGAGEIAADAVPAITTNRRKVIQGIRIVAEQLARRSDIGGEYRPREIRLEPEIETAVQQVEHQSLALGNVAGRDDAEFFG